MKHQLHILGVEVTPMLPYWSKVMVKRKRWGVLINPYVDATLLAPSAFSRVVGLQWAALVYSSKWSWGFFWGGPGCFKFCRWGSPHNWVTFVIPWETRVSLLHSSYLYVPRIPIWNAKMMMILIVEIGRRFLKQVEQFNLILLFGQNTLKA